MNIPSGQSPPGSSVGQGSPGNGDTTGGAAAGAGGGAHLSSRAIEALESKLGLSAASKRAPQEVSESTQNQEYFDLYFGSWSKAHGTSQRNMGGRAGSKGASRAGSSKSSSSAPVSGRGFFSSDLSVDEAVVVRQTGYEPISFVIGSCVYHTGMPMGVTYGQALWAGGGQGQGWGSGQGSPWAGGGQGSVQSYGGQGQGSTSGIGMEIGMLSTAMHDARSTSLKRLADEGRRVGGSGVVGVELLVSLFSAGDDTLSTSRFLALGTAIRGEYDRGVAGSGRAVSHSAGHGGMHGQGTKFFSSHLNGQDFYLLLKAGYMPVQVVMGSCVYYVRTRNFATMTNMANMEIEAYTRALYDARERAMDRMQKEAAACGADGVVGVTVEESSRGWGGSHTIEFFAMGTAIVQVAREHIKLSPKLTVPLEDEIVRTSPTAMHKERD